MESMVGRKVMAAIVMTSDQISIDIGCVISLATGQCHLVIDTHTHTCLAAVFPGLPG